VPPPPPTPSLALATFVITLPTHTAQIAHRAPAYVSAATKSAKLVITPSGGTPNPATIFECTATQCGGSVAVPIGTDTFDVGLYSETGGEGDLLSSGSTTYDIQAGQSNSISMTFNPVVASLAFSPTSGTCTAGDACALPLHLHVLDAAGDTIVGPGSYVTATGSPVTIALQTTLSGSALQTSTGTAAATSATTPDALDLAEVAYDGSGSPGPQTVTANDGNGHTATFMLTIAAPAPGTIAPLEGASATLAFLAAGSTYAQTLNFAQTFSSTAFIASDTCTGIATYVLSSNTSGSGYNATEDGTLVVTPVAAGSCTIAVSGSGGQQMGVSVGVTTTTIGGQ
jgi:hypothetical protein